MNINFKHNLSKNNLLSDLNNLGKNSVVIFWYVGAKGLMIEGVKYYQKLFRGISNDRTKRVLYDLTAWQALFDTNFSIHQYNQQLADVTNLTSPNIISLKSSDFFTWITNSENKVLNEFITRLIVKEKLFSASDAYNDSKIKFSELEEFANFSTYPIYDKDTSKCYSFLQYIEIFYLIHQIINQGFKEIYFALPNDELKYYSIEDNDFASDLETFFSDNNVSETNVTIHICSFKFGNRSYQRPYNIGRDKLDNLTSDFL